MDREAHPAPRKALLPYLACAAGLLSVCAIAIDGLRFVPVFAAIEVELPLACTWALDFGSLVSTPLGWVAVAAALALGYLPIRMGCNGPRARRRYRAAAIASAVLAVLVYFAVRLPIDKLAQHLDADETATQQRR